MTDDPWPICILPKTNVERQRAYRARRKASGLPPPVRGLSKPRRQSTHGDFICIDGEGEDYGPLQYRTVEGERQSARAHKYTLLAAFDGEEYSELYRDGERLRTADILAWMHDLHRGNPNGILCGFVLGYDWNHWFLFDENMTREKAAQISSGALTRIEGNGCFYEIRLRMRKSLEVRCYSGLHIDWKLSKSGKHCPANRVSFFTVWDVWGFFQGSFVSAVSLWLGEKHPDLVVVKRMKAERGNFENVSHDEIAQYNRIEVKLLHELMLKVRVSLKVLSLSINRWDGAGAVASAMNRVKKTREYMSLEESPAFHPARHAYSGGHIEAMQIGVHPGTIHHYDLNSAYPSQYRHLPNLRMGVWHHGPEDRPGLPPHGFTCVRCSFDFPARLHFYPLFYREPDGSIRYPASGHGWYWSPEYTTAVEFAAQFGGSVKVLEWWHFEPTPVFDVACIFAWVSEYYAERQAYVREAKAGRLTSEDNWKIGAEKTIKLGLNSLYGKTAQQVGGREGKPPSYFCLEWAGYITSSTRAALMRAAMLDPPAIVAFATDGIYSTRPLALDCPEDKVLGAWEYTQHDGMTIVMSGVYWQFDAGKHKGFSRGFEKDAMENPSLILEAWKFNKSSLSVPSHRLIGIGSAHLSAQAWDFRGRFVSSDRELCLTGDNSKRHGFNATRKSKPWESLLRTYPREAINHQLQGLNGISAPYPIKWIDDNAKAEIDGRDYMTEEEAREFDNHFNMETV